MSKNKLKRFAANDEAENVIQEGKAVYNEIKGGWNSNYFTKNNPITLEIGCGNGEYTVGLAKVFPDKNFIGMDIKGARIWQGSQEAKVLDLKNVAFLRTRVEFTNDFFEKDEISEIWITFPDPQLKDAREKHRLTHPRFLKLYKSFLKPSGLIHLKTDSIELFEYTLEVLANEKLDSLIFTKDLYNSPLAQEHFNICTKYEKMYLKAGKKINYLKFQFSDNQT
jgi:tRNA (guanine-N7-)-methyltransferase